ncbi:MAG: ANTAR domain-containing protein [Planctomycetota bacterium]
MSKQAQEQRIRVMVADDNELRGELLVKILVENGYDVVGMAGPDSYLPTQVAQAKPDLILIDTDAPTRDTLEQLSVIKQDMPRPVVMFSSDEAQDTIRAAVRAGVSAYICDGLSNAKVKPVIDVAIAHFQQHQTMREELERTKISLEERKTIDRAKGIVMKKKECREDEAFALLRKVAMDQKKRIGQVAAEIVQVAGLFSGEQQHKEVGS